ncbi:hypothetical protein PR048_012555 [Dryococelus australis]|uniref:Uncharacterized protein n=1 Tax=Dryococelus australis TaxID=614101 RepID=A0ABQ9HQF1_9NEOP|nr:hypothetical protein PR048_012555 [Dryococelus australis]
MGKSAVVMVLQPYRTTPLVLPGAKVKKDTPATTMSYLRHHPNPLFRAAPPHYDSSSEVIMKQKVNESYFSTPSHLLCV